MSKTLADKLRLYLPRGLSSRELPKAAVTGGPNLVVSATSKEIGRWQV